jgi:hypothetical protein
MGIANNAIFSGLIHAPSAIGIVTKGTTNPSTGITGAIWVDSWDTKTNNASILVNQSGSWSDFQVDVSAQPTILNPIRSWQPTKVGN